MRGGDEGALLKALERESHAVVVRDGEGGGGDEGREGGGEEGEVVLVLSGTAAHVSRCMHTRSPSHARDEPAAKLGLGIRCCCCARSLLLHTHLRACTHPGTCTSRARAALASRLHGVSLAAHAALPGSPHDASLSPHRGRGERSTSADLSSAESDPAPPAHGSAGAEAEAAMPSPATQEVVETVKVPAKIVGPIICGPRKAKLHRLQAESGARIVIPKPGANGRDFQILSICGTSSQVLAARLAIEQLIPPCSDVATDEAAGGDALVDAEGSRLGGI